jgi:hypothetical protein
LQSLFVRIEITGVPDVLKGERATKKMISAGLAMLLLATAGFVIAQQGGARVNDQMEQLWR